PTVDEHAAFQAQAAAYRSADLSRQVGAVITKSDGRVLASGYNDVPIARGGHYIPGHDDAMYDDRDYKRRMDPSSAAKHGMVAELFERLQTASWLASNVASGTVEELTERALGKPREELDG